MLNLPLGYVRKLYKEYLETTKFERLLKLYDERGDAWLSAIDQIHQDMDELSYRPESLKPFVDHAMELHKKGWTHKLLLEDAARISESNSKLAKEYEEKVALKNDLDTRKAEVQDKIKAANAELNQIREIIKEISLQNPRATTVKIAYDIASEMVKNEEVILDCSVEAVRKTLKNGELMYHLVFPDKMPKEFQMIPEKKQHYLELCKRQLINLYETNRDILLDKIMHSSLLEVSQIGLQTQTNVKCSEGFCLDRR